MTELIANQSDTHQKALRINLDPRWFAPHLAYTMSKYGMSMVILGLAEELKPFRIAANALWPKTTIATAAVKNLLGGDFLEIRSGMGVHRIRYDQIDSIQGGASSEIARPRSLWPGAGFGYAARTRHGLVLARASSLHPAQIVVVGAAGSRVVTSVQNAPAFKEALIQRASQAVPSTCPASQVTTAEPTVR